MNFRLKIIIEMKYLKIILLSFMLLCTGTLFAQNYYVNLTANGGKTVVYAEPGDEITFEISENIPGPTTRNVFFLDYVNINWKNGHKWIATPGIHYVRRYIRWKENTPLSQIDDEDSTQNFMQKWVIIIVGGAESENSFRHPGLMVTSSGLEQIQKNILIDGHPMKAAWTSFKKYTDRKWLDRQSHAMDTLNMIKNNRADRKEWGKDGKAIFANALCWAISGDQKYANTAINILNDWASVNVSLMATWIGQNPYLHTTHAYGDWLEAVELLKYYKGHGGSKWSKEDVTNFDKYMREVLAPMTIGWGGHGNGVWDGQNQNLNVYKARMMSGIYLNDKGMFDAASYLMFEKKRSYAENMAVHGKNSITYVEQSIGSVNHPGELMEINRGSQTKADFGHMLMCVTTIHQMAELLSHQQGYVDEYNFYELKIDDSPTPRLVHMIDWLTKMAIIGGPYVKADFNGESGEIVSANSATGAVRSKYKDTQKVRGRTDKHTSKIQQMYNWYHYVLKDKYALPQEYKQEALNGRGSTIDILLHARLNDGWVSPDTIKQIINSSVDVFAENHLKIYPNPTSSIINVTGEDMDKVTVFNMHGEIVKTYLPGNNNHLEINLINQPTGIYFIKILSGDKGVVKKIIKK